MKKTIFSIAVLASITACSSSSDNDNAGDGLFFSAAPCPNQTILKDNASLATLKTALLNGTLSYLDIPYNAQDSDNFKKKCGLVGSWDPALATDEIPGGTNTINYFLQSGNAGICTSNSNPATFAFGTDEGFAAAGTYLKQFKVAYQGTTYLIRTRSEVSGAEAGNKFTDAGIADISTFTTTNANYEVNGVASSHNALWTDFINGFSLADSALPEATLTVKNAGGSAIWNAETELYCAATL